MKVDKLIVDEADKTQVAEVKPIKTSIKVDSIIPHKGDGENEFKKTIK